MRDVKPVAGLIPTPQIYGDGSVNLFAGVALTSRQNHVPANSRR